MPGHIAGGGSCLQSVGSDVGWGSVGGLNGIDGWGLNGIDGWSLNGIDGWGLNGIDGWGLNGIGWLGWDWQRRGRLRRGVK